MFGLVARSWLLLTSLGFDYRTVPTIKGEQAMWKKSDSDYPETPASSPSSVPEQPTTEQAVIGTSLVLKGDVTGENDLLIQGQVEGKVVLKKNSVTVGKNGRVKADIYGKVIRVDGKVQGNLFGDEKIIINRSGDVRGNLSAPSVTLEDGALFKGSIDMEAKAPEKSDTTALAATADKTSKPVADVAKEKEDAGKSGLKLT